ncbi:MAG: hypothetical protein HRU34_08810 [Richelia sp.]|nr:hypothetical protein [Richelia sp.]CDN10249.1 hypothetical protein RintRC_4334 [Richelia intracellularis]
MTGVAESGDDFTKFSTLYQWFQTLIHPALMQRHLVLSKACNQFFLRNPSFNDFRSAGLFLKANLLNGLCIIIYFQSKTTMYIFVLLFEVRNVGFSTA